MNSPWALKRLTYSSTYSVFFSSTTENHLPHCFSRRRRLKIRFWPKAYTFDPNFSQYSNPCPLKHSKRRCSRWRHRLNYRDHPDASAEALLFWMIYRIRNIRIFRRRFFCLLCLQKRENTHFKMRESNCISGYLVNNWKSSENQVRCYMFQKGVKQKIKGMHKYEF